MTTSRTLLTGAALALGLASSARATLVWSSDFSSYNTTGGAVALTINTNGDDDTFTAATPNAGLSATAVSQIRGTGVPSFMSGNALYIGGTSAAASISFSLQQAALPSLGSSGLSISSFDLYNVSPTVVSVIGEARTATGRSGSSRFTSNMPVNTAVRVSIVINRSGGDVSLPGALGALPTGSLAIYRFDGTTYSGLSTTNDISSTSVRGFATGLSLSSSTIGSTYGLWFDNFGTWDSAADTVNGTSILSLAPGTMLSSVPEPASTASLIGLFALAGTVGLRRKRR